MSSVTVVASRHGGLLVTGVRVGRVFVIVICRVVHLHRVTLTRDRRRRRIRRMEQSLIQCNVGLIVNNLFDVVVCTKA